jgi:hypothetical protein
MDDDPLSWDLLMGVGLLLGVTSIPLTQPHHQLANYLEQYRT